MQGHMGQSAFVPFAFACFHPSGWMVLMWGMLIIAWTHNCSSRPGERKLKPETAAERFASIRPSVTSPATCAMLAMASPACGRWPQLRPVARPSASLWINKNLFPWRLASARAASTSLARMKIEDKEEVGAKTAGEKSQTAELFAAANAGELIWKALLVHGLLFSHCMQMCYYSCLTRIGCVSALSFKVPIWKKLSTLLWICKKKKKSSAPLTSSSAVCCTTLPCAVNATAGVLPCLAVLRRQMNHLITDQMFSSSLTFGLLMPLEDYFYVLGIRWATLFRHHAHSWRLASKQSKC